MATVIYIVVNRFEETTVEKMFTWILYEVKKKEYLSTEVVFIDAGYKMPLDTPEVFTKLQNGWICYNEFEKP